MPRRRPRNVPADQVDEAINEIRKHSIPPRTAREDLDRPLDGDIQATAGTTSTRLALTIGGQEVSGLTVVDFRQQIGSCVVRMGGIAGVGTHRDHRFKGYGRRVLEASLVWMRRQGYDVAMLYGIPSFYPRFGYAQAFAWPTFSIAVRDAETVTPAGFRFVAYRAEHLQALLRMYRRNNAGRTGPTLRDARTWRPWRQGIRWGPKVVCKVAVDRTGRPAGYLAYDDQHLAPTVIEVGFATPRVFADILRAAGRIALAQRLERIKLILPADDAFIEYCKPLGLHEEVHYRREGGAQVRMIHVVSALEHVADELGSRVRGAGRLTIRTNLDDVGLTWRGGRLTVGPPHRSGPRARMPQWALAQLLYGHRTAEGLAANGTLRAAAPALASLGELFPPRPHFHYMVDKF